VCAHDCQPATSESGCMRAVAPTHHAAPAQPCPRQHGRLPAVHTTYMPAARRRRHHSSRAAARLVGSLLLAWLSQRCPADALDSDPPGPPSPPPKSSASSSQWRAPTTTKPHILHILLDDFGWAEIGFHRPAGYREVQTPTMDGLAAEGLQLDRFCKSVSYLGRYLLPPPSSVLLLAASHTRTDK
jgi:hypothetical protein